MKQERLREAQMKRLNAKFLARMEEQRKPFKTMLSFPKDDVEDITDDEREEPPRSPRRRRSLPIVRVKTNELRRASMPPVGQQIRLIPQRPVLVASAGKKKPVLLHNKPLERVQRLARFQRMKERRKRDDGIHRFIPPSELIISQNFSDTDEDDETKIVRKVEDMSNILMVREYAFQIKKYQEHQKNDPLHYPFFAFPLPY